MSDKLTGTIKAQFTALCDGRKAANKGLLPLTADEVAAVLVRSILIEMAAEQAHDLIPKFWDLVPANEKADLQKANREQRAALAALVSPWITASSNSDKVIRKEGLLPAKPTTDEAPEFA